MYPHHVTKNSTLVFERDNENLSTLKNQLDHQVHPQSLDPDNGVSPLIQDSGSGSLDNEGSTSLGNKGIGSLAH